MGLFSCKRNVFFPLLLCIITPVLQIQGQEFVLVPTCPVDQFLTSNGTDLFCTALPDAGFCNCSDFVPVTDIDETLPIFPLPPPGCEQFEPPTRGAFVCLRQPTIIYCSVLCDHRFEFFTAPHNPYRCGEDTGFVWLDVTGARQRELPKCTGFRHRLETLYPDRLYLPAPCYGLTDNTIAAFLREFFTELKNKSDCTECTLGSTFLRCPRIPASAQFFSGLIFRDDYHK